MFNYYWLEITYGTSYKLAPTREKGVEIAKDIKQRPDGILQMFVKDPDGYFLEFTQL
ncbi:MAG TPA: hypothetical protein VK169_11375 [Saprospiraceae bacterium]|nr:hypothetical protein [Saprospiraceae bacterium]